ncbi:hypothetical protein RclHR1_35770001 [Rhizophagus clarus]|nr:hypothetical protein RclHR1_35770001 [Rhizophagus clarus]
MAIICYSSDIPAARKLCGHISALAACHRCYKQANNGNFSGFDDMVEWFKTRDLEEFCKNVVKWRNYKSKDERNYHVSNNLDLLSVDDYEILENFVRACSLLVYQIISTNKLNEAHSRLIKIGRLIEECYGKGSYPNSKRYIEPELLRIIMQNCRINDLISVWTNDQRLINGLKLIELQKTTGSLAAYDDLESETLLQFKQIFCCELEDTITSSEFYPGKFLNPIKNYVELPENLYEYLITYYNEVYCENMNVEFNSMSNLINKGLQNDSYIVMQSIINQCGRIQIAAEIFRSALAP